MRSAREKMSLTPCICMACLLLSPAIVEASCEARYNYDYYSQATFVPSPVTYTIDAIERDAAKISEITLNFLELASGKRVLHVIMVFGRDAVVIPVRGLLERLLAKAERLYYEMAMNVHIDLNRPTLLLVLCASILSGARRGMVWLSQGSWSHQWWLKSVEELAAECTPEALSVWYSGAINVVGRGRPMREDSYKPLGCFEGYSAEGFRSLIAQHFESGFPIGDNDTVVEDPHWDVYGHAVDAICLVAFTISSLLYGEGYTIRDIQNPDALMYERFVSKLKHETVFRGVSGRVEFYGNDRPNYLAIQQISVDDFGSVSVKEVGEVTSYGRIQAIDGGPSNAYWTKEAEPSKKRRTKRTKRRKKSKTRSKKAKAGRRLEEESGKTV